MTPYRHKIYGAPGTGKTTRGLELVSAHLAKGDRVLFVSFTKRAQLEAEGRLLKQLGTLPEGLTVRTLHSLALRGLNVPKDCLAVGGRGAAKFARLMRLGFKGGADSLLRLGLDHSERTRGLAGRAYQAEMAPFIDRGAVEAVATRWEGWKREEGLNDFTDLIVRAVQGEGTFEPYDVVIIDEAQDLVTLHWRFVERLTADAHTVYAIGDDDQAIYAFMGADIAHFLAWPADRIEVLSKSYRLSEDVNTYAHFLIQRVRTRQPKQVASNGRRSQIIHGVLNWYALPFGEIAGSELILVRNHYMGTELARMLQRYGIPYKSKYSPYTTYPARGVLEMLEVLLRWVTQPIDSALYKKHRQYLTADIRRYFDQQHAALLAPYQRAMLPRFEYSLVTEPEWWLPFFEIPNPEISATFRLALRAHTVQQCLAPTMEIASIHSAKGLEADRVYVCPDLSRTQQFASTRGHDEDRLFYVAITRTKGDLYLLHPSTDDYYDFPNPIERT